MSTGYDEVEDLKCLSPPGGEQNTSRGIDEHAAGAMDEDFKPNVILYNNYNNSLLTNDAGNVDFGQIGVNHFSFDMWFLPSHVFDTFQDNYLLDKHGLLQGIVWGSRVCGITVSGTDLNAQFHVAGGAGGILQASTTYANLVGWTYVAATFQRDGLARLYINSVEVDTVDISAHAAVDITVPYRYGADMNHADATAANAQSIGACGPFAFHEIVLTQAEISEAYRNKRCVNNPAEPGSEGYYDVRNMSPRLYYHDWRENVIGPDNWPNAQMQLGGGHLPGVSWQCIDQSVDNNDINLYGLNVWFSNHDFWK